jgi:hypothetical protein
MFWVMVPLGPNTIWIWHEKSQEAPVLAVVRHWPASGRTTVSTLAERWASSALRKVGHVSRLIVAG